MVDGLPIPPEFSPACAAIARAIVHSRPLEDVLIRITDAVRLVAPFEGIGMFHAETPEAPVKLRVRPGTRESTREVRRLDISPQFWPTEAERFPLIIGDAEAELDASFPGDALLIQLGYRSVLVYSLRPDAKEILWLVHREKHVYRTAHARVLQPVADLATLAIEHDHLHGLVAERRRRSDVLEALLHTMATGLDVPSVYAQISNAIRDVLPHDYSAIGLVTEDGANLRVHASTSYRQTGVPEYRIQDVERGMLEWDFFIALDNTLLPDQSVRIDIWDPKERRVVPRVFKPLPFWLRAYTHHGVRAELRVPIRLRGERVGFLFLSSRQPNLYTEEDAALARRVADHLALALAHEQLAQEVARTARLQDRVDALVKELEDVTPHRALGRSTRWRDVLADATKVAATDTTVLVLGESGTGKEVVARYIHRASRRGKGCFVALNCAALPEQLLEAELFGYERGAFTGAVTSRPGRIEQANGGVLFLDEVAEMSPPVQAKFLRVLQEREFQRLGGSATLKADIRVIAATNRDPRLAMERGTLREDLYYRLSVFEITLPALRERGEDILVLAEAFLEEIGRSVGRPAAGFSRDARDRLLSHAWPGNVRELRNAIERAVILCDGGLITSDHLPIALGSRAATPVRAAVPAPTGAPAPPVPAVPPPAATPSSLEALEREMIEKAMAQAHNNKSEAARLLGLPRGQLYSKLKRFGMTRARR